MATIKDKDSIPLVFLRLLLMASIMHRILMDSSLLYLRQKMLIRMAFKVFKAKDHTNPKAKDHTNHITGTKIRQISVEMADAAIVSKYHPSTPLLTFIPIDIHIIDKSIFK